MLENMPYVGKTIPGILAACAAMLLSVPSYAADPVEDSTQQVVVNGARGDPEKISYAKILDAMDYFDKNHSEAPAAILKFRLVPTHRFDTSTLTVKIKTDDETVSVKLDADLTFTMPRLERLRNKDAYLVVNKKSDNFLWRSYVQTPGIAPDQRRLGDMRVECRINFKSGLEHFMGPGGPIVGPIYAAKMDDPCYAPTVDFPAFFTFHPVFNVTLSDGDRKLVLETKYLWRSGHQDELVALAFVTNFSRAFSYSPPMRDASWSNNAILNFDFMDDAPADTASTNR
jgi:hypothetical protein